MSGPMRDIDEVFYNNIEGYSEYPADKVWENIEADLDKNAAIIYKRKYKAVKRSAAVLLCLLAGVLLYEVVGLRKQKEKVPVAGPEVSANASHAPEAVVTRQENIVSVEKKIVMADQLPVPSTDDIKIPGEPGKGQPDANGYQADISTGKEEIAVSKSAVSNAVKNNSSDFVTMTSPIANIDENTRQFNAGAGNLAVSDDGTNNIQQRLLSFNLTPVDHSWERDIANGSGPVFVSKPVLPNAQLTAMKINSTDRNISRFSVALQFSPSISWNTISDNKRHSRDNGGNGSGGGGGGNGGGGAGGGSSGGGSVVNDNKREYKRNEHNSIAYYGGVKLDYSLGKKLSVGTGLTYLASSTIVNSKKIYAAKDNNGSISYRFNCSSGYSYLLPHGARPAAGDSIVVGNSRNAISYLGIPLTLEYKIFSSGRFSLAASAGGQLNILLKAKTTAIFNVPGLVTELSAVSSPTRGLRSSYFSFLTSLAGEMRLNRRISLTLAPTGQFGLSYINANSWVKTRANYLGLAAGLKLKL
ncbi:MAG: outer membrane beta-barrel protein [Bacteroidota bacterium]